MVANILIAGAFFALGVVVGGVFTLRSCWNEMERLSKEVRKAQSDPLILRVYDAKK